jgi:hypothetical protein
MNYLVLSFLMGSIAFLSSCNKNNTISPALEQEPSLTRSIQPVSRSKEILPDSRAKFDYTPRPGSASLETAHGVPPMDRLLRGPYSYEGAAAEFKDICGLIMPDWVEPSQGDYSVHRTTGAFVCQARLRYKIDPARKNELQEAILNALAIRWPGGPAPFTETVQPGPNGTSYWSAHYNVKQDKTILYNASIGIDTTGQVTISNSRGPEGWDR